LRLLKRFFSYYLLFVELKDKNTKNLQVSTKTQADSFYLYLLII
jgi:hypothetical protein